MRALAFLTLFFLMTSISISLGEHQALTLNEIPNSKSTLTTKSSLLKIGLTGTLVPQHGFRIDKIVSKSLGNKLGLDKGDLLLRVNGVRIRSDNDMKKAMSLMQSTFIICVKDVNGRGIYRLKGELESNQNLNKTINPKTSLNLNHSDLRTIQR